MNICILANSRSGSNWMCSIFNQEYYCCCYELYNPVMLVEKAIKEYDSISSKNNDSTITCNYILHTLYKIIQEYDRDRLNNPSISNNYLDKIINFNIFEQLSSSIYNSGKHFVYKILCHQYEINKKIIDKTIDDTDYIIKLYRNNILDQFISLEKAKNTYVWLSSKDNLTVDKNNYKFLWNEKKYINFYNYTIKSIGWIINSFPNKKSVCFNYEEIHNQQINKVLYIKNKIDKELNIKLYLNDNNIFNKENKINQYSDHFSNPEEFLKSYHNIPLYYNE